MKTQRIKETTKEEAQQIVAGLCKLLLNKVESPGD